MDNFSDQKGKNYILSIGIDKYEDASIPNIRNGVRNLKAIISILEKKYHFEPENIYELYDEEATEEGIDRSLINFKDRLRVQDNLLILFSGHSFVRLQTNEGYWLPYNSKQNSISRSISNTELFNIYIEKMKARHIFLIADAYIAQSSAKQKFTTSESSTLFSRQVLALKERVDITNTTITGKDHVLLRELKELLRREKPVDLSAESLISKVALNIPEFELFKLQKHDWHIKHKSKEDIFWKKVKEDNSETQYRDYIMKYPDGQYLSEAYHSLSLDMAERAWRTAQDENTLAGYEKFLLLHQHSKYANLANDRIQRIQEDAKNQVRGINRRTFKRKFDQDSVPSAPTSEFSPPKTSAKSQIEIRKHDKESVKSQIVIRRSSSKAVRSSGSSTSPNVSIQKKNSDRGKFLCNIPRQMNLGESHSCEVRIAPVNLSDALFFNKLDEVGQVDFNHIKISKVMLVELSELGEEGNFEIQALNDLEQLVEEDGFTFWKYNIIPKKVGQFELIIKITARKQTEEYGERSKDVLIWDKLVEVASDFSPLMNSFDLVKTADNFTLNVRELRKLISENQLNPVIDQLESFFEVFDHNLLNQITQIKSSLKRTNDQFLSGIISSAENQLNLNRVNNGLLELINKIDFKDTFVSVQNMDEQGRSITLEQVLSFLDRSVA